MERLCQDHDLIVVVGGRNSNNTRQLAETALQAGVKVRQVETAADLHDGWFQGVDRVGVTAGTSTLDETVQAVVARLKQIDATQRASSPVGRLAPIIQQAAAALC
jgi:4-hydroxy-3-methylbut-2-enyl diphosphate reductase